MIEMTRRDDIERKRAAGLSDKEIARELGICRERVAQIAGRRSVSEAVLIFDINQKKETRRLLELARERVFVGGEDPEVVRRELGLVNQRNSDELSRVSRNVYLKELGLRYCPRCKSNHPLGEFLGTQRYCKSCRTVTTRAYRARKKLRG